MTTRRRALFAGLSTLAIAGAAVGAAVPAALAQDAPLKVIAAYSSVIEEPWDGVIHAALEAEEAAGRITHEYQDGIGYDGGMELALREIAEADQPDIIFGDSFGNEEAVRKVAADYPDIPFVFGSGGGPAEPNFSVFDNWIHEPAYLAGWLAGGLTKSNTIGVVAGYPVPEVNRITNAFIEGAQRQEPRGGRQGDVHQQLVRPGHRQGGRAGPDRCGRGRALRGARRRHRGGQGEGRPRRRQHGRPAGGRPGERHHQRHLEHDPDRRVRGRPGHRRHLHQPGPQGLLDDGQGRRRTGADQHRRHRRHPAGAHRRGHRGGGVHPSGVMRVSINEAQPAGSERPSAADPD